MSVIGFDIGGVNTKAARVADGRLVEVRSQPFELQRAPGALAALLGGLARDLDPSPATGGEQPCTRWTIGITMTAELSQIFRRKREGVAFILDAVAEAFPGVRVFVFTVEGSFVTPAEARAHPLLVAAANWAAAAHLAAGLHPTSVLVDIGTTTTDIIPIVDGRVCASGCTDPERLASGELVYCGAVRTPVEALVPSVPVGPVHAGVSAEGFALSGDVHVWRGDLDPRDYAAPTPDGRPATREFAAERLARVVCADRDMLDDAAIDALAAFVAESQAARICEALRRVAAAHPSIDLAVTTGLGSFLAERAARLAGLQPVPLSAALGKAAAHCAPAAATAILLERWLRGDRPAVVHLQSPVRAAPARQVDLVVKIGGGLLRHPPRLDAALRAVEDAASARRILVVPGGGPFADVVRQVDGEHGLAADAAHWMAILGMDQYAHLLAARLSRAAVACSPGEIAAAFGSGRLPVVAPSSWLRAADPLPHCWDVTSDSIAAWIAGALGAPELVLVKPPGATGALVDPYFDRACPAGVRAIVIPADRLDAAPSPLRPAARI